MEPNVQPTELPPKINSELEQLASKLAEIEDELITDEMVEESILKAFEFLEKIYGEKFIEKTVARMKALRETQDLKETIRKSIKKKRCITQGNAEAFMGKGVGVTKNSYLSDFLVDNGKITRLMQDRITDFFNKHEGEISKAIAEGNQAQVKEHLTEYIYFLEKNKEFLRRNMDKIRNGKDNIRALETGLLHEIMHLVFYNQTYYDCKYFGMWHHIGGVDESIAYSMQLFSHTYKQDYAFSKENFMEEIRKLYYKFVDIKRVGYASYDWQRCLIPLFTALMFADAMARKGNDFGNKELYLRAHSAKNFLEIFECSKKAIENLPESEIKYLMKKYLLDVSVSELRKIKEKIIRNLNEAMAKLEANLNIERCMKMYPGKFDKKLKVFLIDTIVKDVINYHLNSLHLLKIMGCEDEARDYANRFNKRLQELLKKFFADVDAQENLLLSSDNDTIKVLSNAVEKEDVYLKEIVQNMACWK